MNREGQSKIIEAIFAEMAKKEDKPKDEKEQALSVIDRFKQPKHKLHVKKHVEKLEKGHEPKKVLKDFFKDLRKVSSNDEIENIMKEANNKTVKLDKDNVLEIEATKDGSSFKISINGTITSSSGQSIEDVIRIIKKAWLSIMDF